MSSLSKPVSAEERAKGTYPAGSMRAIAQERYGLADVLQLRSMPRPTPSAREVLMHVRAAGLGRSTWHLMTGKPYAMRLGFGMRGPKQPVAGQDVAGTVVAIGEGVTRFAVGDEVFGVGRGSFAEYTVALESKLTHKPKSVSFADAASSPVSAITAMQAIRCADLAAGQSVLVIGASGGVGSFAVQLAKAAGAEVSGTCSTKKVSFVRQLGADHVIDYTRAGSMESDHRYDVILDIGGNTPLARLRRALTPSGVVVLVGGENAGNWVGMSRQVRALILTPFIRQRLVMLMGTQSTADLDELSALLGAGTITARVDTTFPLESAPDAMRYLEAGKAQGKIVITV
ncbi:NAD(P)-dependent alcohol dehydrogenase [Diaminobutyricibacter sp. McL0608]|uniref:NAD(P)-dependent alcohol dehydrogenase n=1 Tax=Leifsonia sp. McL0608 TaxID=3143537 RepID=UPI0031F30EEA